MHMQASKTVSLPWRRSRQAMRAWVRQAHKPTDDQTFGSASRQVVFAAQPTPTTSPKMLGQFPLRPTGAAEACAGPESCCGSAAPTASPRTLFLTQAQCDGTQAPSLVMLYVQNSRDKARRGYFPRLARHCEIMVAVICEIIGSKFYIFLEIFLFFRGGGWEGP